MCASVARAASPKKLVFECAGINHWAKRKEQAKHSLGPMRAAASPSHKYVLCGRPRHHTLCRGVF